MTSTQSVTDLPRVDGKQPGPFQAPPPAGEVQAAPFSLACLDLPDTPPLAGQGTALSGPPASFLFDPTFLAAWRETQGQQVEPLPPVGA